MSNKTVIERMNKMKKNITAIFITLCMMFSILPVSFAASVPTFTVKLPSGAALNIGEEFRVDFAATSDEKVSQIAGKLKYNTDALEVVGAPAEGNILASAGMKFVTQGNDNVNVVADFATAVELNDTTIFSVTFKVKAVPAAGAKVLEVADQLVKVENGTVYDDKTQDKTVSVTIPEITVSADPVKDVALDAALAQVDGVEKTEYTVGEEITYVITAAKAFNATALQFDLDYDPAYLEFSNGTVNASGIVSSINPVLNNGAPVGKARLLFANPDGAKFEGTVATITFVAKAPTTAAQSSTKISEDGITTQPTAGLVKKGTVDPKPYTVKKADVKIDSTVSVKADNVLVSKGGQVTFTVSISEVTAQGIQLGINFNNFHLKYNNAAKGKDFPASASGDINYDAANKKLNIVVAAQNPVTVSGELATITFDVADTFSYMFTPSVSTNYFELVAGEGKYPAQTDVDTIYLDTEFPVKGLEAAIDAIGEVNDENYKDKEEAVAAAKAAYDALTPEQQATVANKDTLDAAVKAVEDAKADVQAVVDAINAIGDVNADNYKDAAEKAADARVKYDALTEAQKSDVTPDDLKKLTDAEDAVKAAQDAVKAVADAIDALGEVTADNYKDMEKPIADAKAAYDALSDAQKADITAEQKAKLDAAVKSYNDFVAAEKPLKVVVTPTENGYSAAITKKDTLTEAKTIIVAGYDANGIPVEVKVASSNDSSVTIGAANSVKVFVWDVDSMKPFEDAEVVIK